MILLIHLKRFSYDGYQHRKITAAVDFPLKALDGLPKVQLVRRLQSLRDDGRRTLHGLRQELAYQFLVQIRRSRGVADITRRSQVLRRLHIVLHGQGVSGPMTTTTTLLAKSCLES